MGYIIGIALYGLLYALGMKIARFIDPEPPYVPNDIECDEQEKCKVSVCGKTYDCIKTFHVLKTYGYDEDCNLLETVCTHTKYDFQKPLFIPYSERITIHEENGKEIECYVTNDWKSLISYNPIVSERIVKYRKSWKNKRLSMQS